MGALVGAFVKAGVGSRLGADWCSGSRSRISGTGWNKSGVQ